MPFKIVRNDITQMNTDAIVNPANEKVMVGAGCDFAIYDAAGYDTLLAYRGEHIGPRAQGEAFITPGFGLKAKYIIHAVSPIYDGGNAGEEEKLRSCYRESLKLAVENGIKSIAFPLLATGSFGYPKEEGMRIAADEINAFLLKNDMLIYLVVFGSSDTMLGEKLYPDLEAYIDHRYVEKAKMREYGNPYYNSSFNNAIGYNAYAEGGRRMEECLAGNSVSDKRERKAAAGFLRREEEKSAPEAELCSVQADFDVCECDECPEDFEEQHEGRLAERMKHLSDTFSEYLQYLIQEKKMVNSDVWHRAIVDKKVFSKCINNRLYHPNKLTALCLCVGAKLNMDEAKDLLARAGYALSPCDKTDIIFSYFIEMGIYDMIELDIQLEEHGLPCIIK